MVAYCYILSTLSTFPVSLEHHWTPLFLWGVFSKMKFRMVSAFSGSSAQVKFRAAQQRELMHRLDPDLRKLDAMLEVQVTSSDVLIINIFS